MGEGGIMAKITIMAALIFALLVDVFAFSFQLGVADLGGSSQYYNYDESILSQYDAGNYTLQEFNSSDLPSSASGVTTGGEFFTDTFQSLKNWFLETTGLKYAVGMVTAVPNFIKSMGLAPELAYMLGAVWHAITLFLIVAFLRG
jgi:hypothetical protein